MKKGRALRTARKGKGGEHCSQKRERGRAVRLEKRKGTSPAARNGKKDEHCG